MSDSCYYRGNLEDDLKRIEGEAHLVPLKHVGECIGYGRAQQIIDQLQSGMTIEDVLNGAMTVHENPRHVEMLQQAMQCQGNLTAQKILQILWAEELHKKGIPTSGALLFSERNKQ